MRAELSFAAGHAGKQFVFAREQANFIAHLVSKSSAYSTTLVLGLRATPALSETRHRRIAVRHRRALDDGCALESEESLAARANKLLQQEKVLELSIERRCPQPARECWPKMRQSR
jgi:hypothetical protein